MKYEERKGDESVSVVTLEKTVEVLFDDAKWHKGQVRSFDQETQLCVVEFADGDVQTSGCYLRYTLGDVWMTGSLQSD